VPKQRRHAHLSIGDAALLQLPCDFCHVEVDQPLKGAAQGRVVVEGDVVRHPGQDRPQAGVAAAEDGRAAEDRGQRGVDADLDRVREALEANLLGAWRLCEAFIPLMRRHGYGRIVNISSGMAALDDMGVGSPAYRVSKTALNALTRILASELRGSGILVNSVSPGWVRTDMGGSSAPLTPEQSVTAMRGVIARLGPRDSGKFFNYDGREHPW